MAERQLRWYDDACEWLLDRLFNPRGTYADGKPLRPWRELRERPRDVRARG